MTLFANGENMGKANGRLVLRRQEHQHEAKNARESEAKRQQANRRK